MRGNVEVFAIASDGSEKLLLSESNLVVDGAGESIVAMLTTPSSVLGISPRVMDTSNWRWGAISFGPAASSFRENAYFYPEDQIFYRKDNASTSDLCLGVSGSVSSFINQVGTDKILRVLWVSSTIGVVDGATVSSYTPPFRLPSYPDPLNQKLEDTSTAYSVFSGTTSSYGQFENRIMFASGDASSYFQGAYPLSGGPTRNEQLSAVLVSSYEGDFQANPSLNVIVSGPQWYGIDARSSYNYYGSMDHRGFIETKYGVQGEILGGIAGVSGIVNSTDPSDLCVDPRVTVTTKVGAGDVWGTNLYGGIHQMGLWNMDCKKSLETSTVPFYTTNGTYIDSEGVTSRQFRLFSKKTFTENLSHIKDSGVVSGFVYHPYAAISPPFPLDLLIKWTIDFRSQHD